MSKIQPSKPEFAELSYSEITLGYECSFERVIHAEEGKAFARLSGDLNPLHTDESFGKSSPFQKNIVHGMFLASLFSKLVGMDCPGRNSLYFSQTLEFRQPVFYGDSILVKATVIDKSDALQMITLRTEIFKEEILAVTGEARVKVLKHE